MRDDKGRFIKGHKVPNEWKEKFSEAGKDRVVSLETRKKISEGNRGKFVSLETRKRISEGNKGKKITEETRKKLSVSAKKRVASKETRKKMSESKKGKIPKNLAEVHRTNRGENHPNWKGGITSERDKLKHSQEYKDWRTSIFERDDYTCQECGNRGGKLNAHHTKPWSKNKKLRFNIDNGTTLCVSCHRKTDNYGAKIFNNENG